VLAPVITFTGAVALVVAILVSMIIYSFTLMSLWVRFYNAISFQELVCVFFEATSASNAVDRLREYTNSILIGMVYDDPGDKAAFLGKAQQVLEVIAPIDTVQELFALWTYTLQRDDGDCNACGDPVTVTMATGSYDGVNKFTSAFTSITDSTCNSRINVFLGGTTPGSVQTPPYVTIDSISEISNFIGNCGLQYCWTIYRPAAYGGNINTNDPDTLTYPIVGVYRMYVNNRFNNPVNGTEEANCEFSFKARFHI
jgi:hypothetical protein